MSGSHEWVVQCTACRCIITVRAADPQAHMQEPEPRPTSRLLVTCSCCWKAFLYRPEHFFNGSPAPSPECHRQARAEARAESTKLIAAAVIAAIRLNKEKIENSPAVHSKVAESLKLAEMIVSKMKNLG
jgi:hypothetical protein